MPATPSLSNALAPAGAPQASAFDDRIFEIDIALPDGTTTTFKFNKNNTALSIYASGSQFMSANMNTCDLMIYNLEKNLRNKLLTQASPLFSPAANSPSTQPQNRKPVIVTLKVGRASTGVFTLFIGNVISCEMTQPPDIGLRLRSLTNNYYAAVATTTQFPPSSKLSAICANIAQQNNLKLDYEVSPDPTVANFAYAGSINYLITKINEVGGVRASVSQDNSTLIVLNADKAKKNTAFTISQANGMVGIPQVSEQGVTVKVMANPQIQLGGQVTIQSVMNPAANGTYCVLKIDYEVASRDQPFWYTLLCSNLGGIFQGSVGA